MNYKDILCMDFSSRRKRKVAYKCAVLLLESIVEGEINYRDNMPPNLQASIAYQSTDEYISLLEDALDSLHCVYLY